MSLLLLVILSSWLLVAVLVVAMCTLAARADRAAYGVAVEPRDRPAFAPPAPSVPGRVLPLG